MRFTGTIPVEQMKIFRSENLFNLREDINDWLSREKPELTREPIIAVNETVGNGGTHELTTTIVYHYQDKPADQTGIGRVLQPIQD